MPDYKETTVSGSQWQRCRDIHIENPYGQTPHITMMEEQITVLGSENISRPAGRIEFPFDPAATIALRDPVTGELTGSSVTMAEVYGILWSLYMQKAAERDAA